MVPNITKTMVLFRNRENAINSSGNREGKISFSSPILNISFVMRLFSYGENYYFRIRSWNILVHF